MIQNSDQVAGDVAEPLLRNAEDVARAAEQLKNPAIVAQSLFVMPKMVLFAIGMVFGVKDVFRTSSVRAFTISVISAIAAMFVAPIAGQLFQGRDWFAVSADSVVFMLLRGYFGDIMGTHRSKAAFKQNLESATLNPADASAHYNLGLIHQSRGELDQARERFERALQIDRRRDRRELSAGTHRAPAEAIR